MKTIKLSKAVVLFVIAALSALLLPGCGSKPPRVEDFRVEDALFKQMVADTSIFAIEDTEDVFNYPYPQMIPIPDEWESDQVIWELANLFNFSAAVNPVTTDIDMLMRMEMGADGPRPRFDTVDLSGIRDTVLRDCARRIMLLATECARTMADSAVGAFIEERNRILEEEVVEYSGRYFKDYNDTLTDKMILRLDPTQWLPDCYTRYAGEDADPSESEVAALLARLQTEQDFTTRAAIMFAAAGADGVPIEAMQQAMESGRYSPLLFLLWRSYRVTYNFYKSCPSTFCYSYNLRYNHYRKLVFYVYLQYLGQHRDDLVTFNTLARLFSIDDILRFGEYPFGNQANAERFYLYWSEAML